MALFTAFIFRYILYTENILRFESNIVKYNFDRFYAEPTGVPVATRWHLFIPPVSVPQIMEI